MHKISCIYIFAVIRGNLYYSKHYLFIAHYYLLFGILLNFLLSVIFIKLYGEIHLLFCVLVIY